MLKLTIAACLAFVALAEPASADGPPSYELDGNNLKVPGPVLFETASDVLKPESDAVLAYVQGYLAAKDYITLMRIEGHSDSTGSEAMNQKLSERRALAVARWLVGHGVDCKRLIPVGFGSTKPVGDNATPDGRAQNRRMVFANAALRGRMIGGMPADGGGVVAGDPCAAP
ncbi:MAG: OmpA family protein [Myxococcota bacterium]